MARRATRRAPEASRGEILEAARLCFAECGYHSAKVDDIAERAGLSKGAVYWHFEGKRELFLTLLDHEIERFGALMVVGDEAPDARAALEQLSENFLDEIPRVLPMIELTLEYLAQASRDPEMRKRLAHMYDLIGGEIAAFIRRGVEDGSFRDVDAHVASCAVMAALDGLAVQKVVRPELDLAALWRATLDLLLKGLVKT